MQDSLLSDADGCPDNPYKRFMFSQIHKMGCPVLDVEMKGDKWALFAVRPRTSASKAAFAY